MLILNVILVGDFNMPTLEIKLYLSRHFPDWYIGNLGENVYTWSKGSKSSCIDHIIYNRAMSEHVNNSTVCPSFHDILAFCFYVTFC